MKIPYVTWRDGRPRFSPSKTLRDQGFEGCDLRHKDGAWMTPGECLDWSHQLQKKLASAKHKTDAKKAAAKAKAKAERLAMLARSNRRTLTLGQLVERYIDRGMLDPAANTQRTYRFMAKALEEVAPEAYATDAGEVSKLAMRGVYRMLRQERSNSVAMLAIRLISAAYNWAIEEELLDCVNPAYRMKLVQPEPRLRAASVAEFLHLCDQAKADGAHHVYLMLMLGVFTAQRTGDRRALTAANVRDNRLELTQQKTGAFVSMPISKHLANLLPATGPLAALRGGAEAEREQAYYYDFRKLVADAAQTMPSVADIRDQDLRDTAVTWMGRAGCTEQEIMSVTGHSQSGRGRILKHYMQRHADMADQAIAKLDAWFEKEVKKARK